MRPFIRGNVAIRGAAGSDAAVIAEAHVQAWQDAYRGILPAIVLSGFTVASRLEQWRRTLSDEDNGQDAFVAEASGVGIIGFASAGPQRGDASRFMGEIYTLYVLAAWQRRGIGTALLGILSRALERRGRSSASLWVLKDNSQARLFYERHGGVVVAERLERFGQAQVLELAYGWDDVRTMGRGASKRA
ncbi:MAG: GNAT family N-acetyltransferase [Proteobacteria bacterium]|nr:GNAT family N-acetyltransferase [Pseudomonadota bacterium]